jgi:hypothetical protein
VARQLAPDPMRSVRDRARFGTKGRRLDFWELHKRLHTHRILELVQAERKRKAAICTAFVEPSDGLEPSTPSLPWRFPGGTYVHGRALASKFLLQIDLSGCVLSVRARPRVPELMYPSRTRAVLSVCQTDDQQVHDVILTWR